MAEDRGNSRFWALEGTQQDANKLPDGKYMMNGKFVIVKKGKKYDAAGCIVQ